MLLGDLGAEVIKVEPPVGDQVRFVFGRRLADSPYFVSINRNKRSMCVDLGSEAARPVVDALARWADVVLVSLKPPDVPRYGLEEERLRAARPDLVYLATPPLGPRGPQGDEGGYDVLVQGISGLSFISARSERDVPTNTRPAYSDVGTGMRPPSVSWPPCAIAIVPGRASGSRRRCCRPRCCSTRRSSGASRTSPVSGGRTSARRCGSSGPTAAASRTSAGSTGSASPAAKASCSCTSATTAPPTAWSRSVA